LGDTGENLPIDWLSLSGNADSLISASVYLLSEPTHNKFHHLWVDKIVKYLLYVKIQPILPSNI